MVVISERQVKDALFYNHDAIGTINAVIYLITFMISMIAAYYVIMIDASSTDDRSVFSFIAKGPLLVVVLVGAIAAEMVYGFWRTKTKFNEVIKIAVLLASIGFIILSFVYSDKDLNLWKLKPFEFDLSNNQTLMYYILGGFSLVGLIMGYITGTLRVDRLDFLNPSFFAFIISTFVITFGVYRVMSLVYNTLKEKIPQGGYSLNFAFLGVILLAMFAIVVSSRIAALITAWMGGKKFDAYVKAVDEGAKEATERTKQVARVFLLSLVAFSGYLFFISKEKEVVDENHDKGWKTILLILFAGIPLLTLIGTMGVEFRSVAPEFYVLVSNLMIAVCLFVIGVGIIPWSKSVLTGALAIMVVLSISYMISSQRSTVLVDSLLLGFLFTVTKFISRRVLSTIEESNVVSDWIKVLVMVFPIILFGAIWFFRSWQTKTSFALPLTFLLFAIFYSVLFFDTSTNTASNQIIKDKDEWTNLGIDFSIITSIIIIFSSSAYMGKSGVELYNREVLKNQTPIASTMAVYSIYAVLGYAGALLYNNFLANPNFKEFVSSMQTNPKEIETKMIQDIDRAADWGKIFPKLS